MAKTIKSTAEQVRQLRAKMNKVRARNLAHVALRACSVGNSSDTLQAFRKVFGAKSISAPKELDAYGEFNLPSAAI